MQLDDFSIGDRIIVKVKERSLRHAGRFEGVRATDGKSWVVVKQGHKRLHIPSDSVERFGTYQTPKDGRVRESW